MKKYIVGASTCALPRLEAAEVSFAPYREAGVGIAELSAGAEAFTRLGLFSRAREFAEAAAGMGVRIRSMHIPFGRDMDNSAEGERLSDILAMTERYIDVAAALGAEIAVVHPGAEPNPPEKRRELLERCRASLARLGAYASAAGVKLAVENLPRTCLGNCPADLLYLTDSPDLYVCFDTNHSLLQTNVEFLDALAAGGARIATVHVSDYDFVDERHKLPGAEGCVNDWDALLAALGRAGYDGPLVYEVHAPLADIRANFDNVLSRA